MFSVEVRPPSIAHADCTEFLPLRGGAGWALVRGMCNNGHANSARC
jgi:hypothetical protein